jgi:hypothetical protein
MGGGVDSMINDLDEMKRLIMEKVNKLNDSINSFSTSSVSLQIEKILQGLFILKNDLSTFTFDDNELATLSLDIQYAYEDYKKLITKVQTIIDKTGEQILNLNNLASTIDKVSDPEQIDTLLEEELREYPQYILYYKDFFYHKDTIVPIIESFKNVELTKIYDEIFSSFVDFYEAYHDIFMNSSLDNKLQEFYYKYHLYEHNPANNNSRTLEGLDFGQNFYSASIELVNYNYSSSTLNNTGRALEIIKYTNNKARNNKEGITKGNDIIEILLFHPSLGALYLETTGKTNNFLRNKLTFEPEFPVIEKGNFGFLGQFSEVKGAFNKSTYITNNEKTTNTSTNYHAVFNPFPEINIDDNKLSHGINPDIASSLANEINKNSNKVQLYISSKGPNLTYAPKSFYIKLTDYGDRKDRMLYNKTNSTQSVFRKILSTEANIDEISNTTTIADSYQSFSTLNDRIYTSFPNDVVPRLEEEFTLDNISSSSFTPWQKTNTLIFREKHYIVNYNAKAFSNFSDISHLEKSLYGNKASSSPTKNGSALLVSDAFKLLHIYELDNTSYKEFFNSLSFYEESYNKDKDILLKIRRKDAVIKEFVPSYLPLSKEYGIIFPYLSTTFINMGELNIGNNSYFTYDSLYHPYKIISPRDKYIQIFNRDLNSQINSSPFNIRFGNVKVNEVLINYWRTMLQGKENISYPPDDLYKFTKIISNYSSLPFNGGFIMDIKNLVDNYFYYFSGIEEIDFFRFSPLDPSSSLDVPKGTIIGESEFSHERNY